MRSSGFVSRAARRGIFAAFSLIGLPALLQSQSTTAATITATPASLTFEYQLGPAPTLPSAQSVTLKTSQTGLLATLTVTGDYNGDWLEPSIRPGTSIVLPASVSFTVTPTSLAAGSYSAIVTLSATDSSGNPVSQTIAVTLIVASPPSTLGFSPSGGLTFTYVTGGSTPGSRQFLMYSNGAPLSVTISVSGAPWLKLNPTGAIEVGGLYMPVTVSIDPNQLATLAPKSYAANITVSAPTATNKSTTYPITLNVQAAKPQVTDTWPSGVVLNAAGTGATTVVVEGLNFFSTSTVAATGFTSSTTVTVTDSSGSPLSASETISIPVYASGATFLRLTLVSPLPTGYVGTAYSEDLSGAVVGGTGPYTFSATGLSTSGLALSSAGLLSGATPVSGNYQAVVTVTDSLGAQAYMPVNLTIYPTPAPPAGTIWITVGSVLTAATVGTPYSVNLSVAGGTATYAWSSDATTPFPAGLTIDAAGATTAISGTPTSVGPTGNLTQKLLSNGALQVTIPNTYLTKLGVLRMTVQTPTPGGGNSNEAQLQVFGPEPRVLGVGNAASYASGNVCPGELIAIFGTGLGPATLAVYDPNTTPLSTTLPTPAPPAGVTGVQVTDGVTTWNAPLIYTSATQVGAMVPFEVASSPSLNLTVSYAGLTSKPFPVGVVAAVPGIFTADDSGQGQGAILNYVAASNDYTINSSANPAVIKTSPIVVLYITGFGITNPASSTTLPAASGVDTNTPASVTIDGKAAVPSTSAVPAGSFPGLLQINATVPSNATAGKAVPVTVNIGSAAAQSGVTIALK